jgi:seryl-tRNA synthetase
LGSRDPGSNPGGPTIVADETRARTFFEKYPELEEQIFKIQRDKKNRKDRFIDYLRALPNLTTDTMKVKTLDQTVKSFETEEIPLQNKKEPFESVAWWELGYNALRHRTIRARLLN